MDSDSRLSAALINNEHARFAYDELVSVCAQFLGSPIIDNTITRFAENLLSLIESPTALDSEEIKQRIEQMLPVNPEYTHHRGISITDKDCSRLCSLADRVINNTPYTNLNIVDDETYSDNAVNHTTNDVHYVRQENPIQPHHLPQQLPSFVERNMDIEKEEQYDADVTPYDSENDEPILMT